MDIFAMVFEWFLTFLGWVATGIHYLILILLGNRSKAVKRTKQQVQEQAEDERLAECRSIVLSVAEILGYIARQAISREELEKLIYTERVQPKVLADTIRTRIEATPGIDLGDYPLPNMNVLIRLPHSLRDRHMYIIGRSGSGKTNLIRNMIMQDVTFDNGIGVIAPEEELIKEEILPYIPDGRIDDVVYINPAFFPLITIPKFFCCGTAVEV